MPFRHFLRPSFVTNAKTAFVTMRGDNRVKADNDRTHETTYFGILGLNKSKTHSDKRAPVQKFEFAPTADPKDSNKFKNSSMEIFRRLPPVPARALCRQIAHGFNSKDDRMDDMTHPVIS